MRCAGTNPPGRQGGAERSSQVEAVMHCGGRWAGGSARTVGLDRWYRSVPAPEFGTQVIVSLGPLCYCKMPPDSSAVFRRRLTISPLPLPLARTRRISNTGEIGPGTAAIKWSTGRSGAANGIEHFLRCKLIGRRAV